MALFFPPLLSPSSPSALHLSTPTHPSSHHSQFSLPITPSPLTPPHPAPLFTRLPHYPTAPHHTSSPTHHHPLTTHHTSSPLLHDPLTTPSLLLLFSPLTPTLTPPLHHSLKGHNFSMSLNLCRTFLSLKTSFLIIFFKKIVGTKSTKSWNMTAARTCLIAHVQCHRFIFPRAIFYLSKRPLFHIFKSF